MVTSVNGRLVVTGMPRHLLSDRHVRTAKPRAKPYCKADGDGLFLYVPPSGVASWQYRYRLHGKQQTATLGKLADMSLAEARDAAGAARRTAASGTQLTVAKCVQRAKQHQVQCCPIHGLLLAHPAHAKHVAQIRSWRVAGLTLDQPLFVLDTPQSRWRSRPSDELPSRLPWRPYEGAAPAGRVPAFAPSG